MNIDRDIEPSRPAPDRDAGRDRDPARHGHRHESDAKRPRRDFSERVDEVVRDVAAFRVVAQADLITHQFGGHPFAGRRGIDRGGGATGWIERQTVPGPNGGRFTVLVATPAWAVRAAGLWATEGRASQWVFSGAVNTADIRHDVAVYRAACAAHARIEAAAERRRAAAFVRWVLAGAGVVAVAVGSMRCSRNEALGGRDITSEGPRKDKGPAPCDAEPTISDPSQLVIASRGLLPQR